MDSISKASMFFKQHIFLRNTFVGLFKMCFSCFIHIYTYLISVKIMF